MPNRANSSGDQAESFDRVRAAEERAQARRAADFAAAEARGFAPLPESLEDRSQRLTGERVERSGRAVQEMPRLLGAMGAAFFYVGFFAIDDRGKYTLTPVGLLALLMSGVLVASAVLVHRRTRPVLAMALLVFVAGALVVSVLLVHEAQAFTVPGLLVVALLLSGANAIRLAPERFHGGRFDH